MSIHTESPCPVRPASHAQYDTLFSGCQDDTLDHLEYTRAIDFAPQPRSAALTRSKPRRVVRSSFDIREDANIEHGQDTTNAVPKTLKRKTQDRKLSILAQPAQRFQRPRISSTQAVNNAPLQNNRTVTTKDQRVQESKPQQSENRTRLSQKSIQEDSLKKDVRRRTVYIPTDDTTMPTVFLSLFSPLKSKDANASIVNAMEETTSLYSLEARIAAKRRSTKTDKTEQKKTPLGPTKLTTQQPAVHHDVMGKNGGKENIPPGYYGDKQKGIGQNQFPLQPQVISKKPLNPASSASRKTEVRKSLSKRNLESSAKPLGHKSSKILSTVLKLSNPDTLSLKKSGSKGTNAVAPPSHPQRFLQEPQIEKIQFRESLRWSLPKSRSISIDQRYPVLDNDISNPIMYEENWLAHQEIVITQLVNGLFDSSVNDPPTQDPEILRHELLKVYQSDACILLYRRLQASIFYGALAPPKETLRHGSCLGDDLGMKRSFLSFWTDTYDLHVLRAASETVIGRKMTLRPVSVDQKSSNVAARQHKALKRAVETFLETFLIRNLDKGDNEDSQEKVDGKPYRRTLLRSIMLIILLDKARSTPGNSLPKRLFVKNSQHKSSSAAMQALANLLLPSMGDINRQINHLNCILHFSQHQLQDYDYCIQNLAVDLRDGVLLTRLVEILLYSDRSHVIDREDSDDAPFVHKASPVMEFTKWPLSRKLKLPCASRAAKCLNVQIALDALKEVVGGKDLLQDVSAEHIVDGYREKTLALLWVLVGKWGLAEMLDWNDVRSEILRLQKKFQLFQGPCDGGKREPALNFQSHEDLLIDWATSLAKLQGLPVDNLTTSFADGRIFNSIVDEYEAFLPRPRDAKHGLYLQREETKVKHGEEPLQTRLQALGCNSQFASLVAGTTSASRIFDRDVVIGALTFLCSRLLSPTKRVRAAIVIQKAWRQTMSARNAQRRILIKEIAEQCAAVACTRERISWAKSVILKWWREQKRKQKRTILAKSKKTVKSRCLQRL